MRNLFNLITVIAVAFTMFYLGRSCRLVSDDVPCASVDTSAMTETRKKLAFANHVIDSIKEDNREIEMIVVAQQDSIKKVKVELDKIDRRSSYVFTLYREAQRKLDTLSMLHNCDKLAEDFADYRVACEQFVQESDSIISAMYVVSSNKDKMLEIKDGVITELEVKYTKANYQAMVAETGEKVERRKKNKWKAITTWVAVALGVAVLTR